jgi:hypothetical protein
MSKTIGKIQESKGPTICSICRRKKSRVLSEQNIVGKVCEVSSKYVCVFKEEIERMLEAKKFSIGKKNSKNKVELKIGKTTPKFKIKKD